MSEVMLAKAWRSSYRFQVGLSCAYHVHGSVDNMLTVSRRENNGTPNSTILLNIIPLRGALSHYPIMLNGGLTTIC